MMDRLGHRIRLGELLSLCLLGGASTGCPGDDGGGGSSDGDPGTSSGTSAAATTASTTGPPGTSSGPMSTSSGAETGSTTGGADSSSSTSGGSGSSSSGSSTGALCADGDDDDDGVCNGDDQCPGMNDTIDIDANATPDCVENMLLNTELDSDVADWIPEAPGTLAWDGADDAFGEAGSGMAVFTNTLQMNGFVRGATQCVVVAENQTLVAYTQLFIPGGQLAGSGGVNVSFYTNGACGGFNGNPGSDTSEVVDSWETAGYEFTTPAGTNSLLFRLRTRVLADGSDFVVHFDNPLLRVQ